MCLCCTCTNSTILYACLENDNHTQTRINALRWDVTNSRIFTKHTQFYSSTVFFFVYDFFLQNLGLTESDVLEKCSIHSEQRLGTSILMSNLI